MPMKISNKLIFAIILHYVVAIEAKSTKLSGEKALKSGFIIRRPNGTCELINEILIDTEKKLECEQERLPIYYSKVGALFIKTKILYTDELAEIHAEQHSGEYCRNIRR